MKWKYVFIITVMLGMPFAILAQDVRPGTDDYLRQKLGMTDIQLSDEIQTEERADFGMTSGEKKIDDSVGDVLTRVGTTSTLQVPWGDIVSAHVKKNAEKNRWEIAVEVAAEVPVHPLVLGQLFFYADRDGDNTNNEKAGVRGLMDAEYTVTYNPNTRVWDTDYRWYNPQEDFWAYPGSQATHTIVGNTITLHIPAAEIREDSFPNWRVVMGVADSGMTQIDVAPGSGFPPARGQELVSQKQNDWLKPSLITILILVVVAGTVWRIRKQK